MNDYGKFERDLQREISEAFGLPAHLIGNGRIPSDCTCLPHEGPYHVATCPRRAYWDAKLGEP